MALHEENTPRAFMVCGNCEETRPNHVTQVAYSQLVVGINALKVVVLCNRCHQLVRSVTPEELAAEMKELQAGVLLDAPTMN